MSEDLDFEEKTQGTIQLHVSLEDNIGRSWNKVISFKPTEPLSDTIDVFTEYGGEKFTMSLNRKRGSETLDIFSKVLFSSLLHEVKDFYKKEGVMCSTNTVFMTGKLGKKKIFLYRFRLEIQLDKIAPFEDIANHPEQFAEFRDIIRLCVCFKK